MNRGRRPAITTIGQVVDDGTTVTVSNWRLGLCLARCRCHMHPVTGQLVLARDDAGSLGLATFRTDGRRCDCCQPWTADELSALHGFLAKVAALPEHVV